MTNRWGAARVGKFIALIRKIFNDAREDDRIEKVVRFSSAFKVPDRKKAARKKRAVNGKKLFTRAEIRLILKALDGEEVIVTAKNGKQSKVKLPPNPQLKAIVVLALNAGLGNTDVSGVGFPNVDFELEWLDFPGSKTGFPRRAPLWPQNLNRSASSPTVQLLLRLCRVLDVKASKLIARVERSYLRVRDGLRSPYEPKSTRLAHHTPPP